MRRVSEVPAFVLRRVCGPALKRIPFVRGAVRGTMNGLFRTAMIPFGRNRPNGVARESTELVGRTDELNRAAEHYFTAFDATAFLLAKPFSDPLAFPRHLISLGTIAAGIRLQRSDVVVELGAGTCWVSHFLNRFGCRTISVDVSPTALELGRELFRREPSTNWDLAPQFLAYDGHRLPLADGSCDKVVIIDAFHHIPNQREILTELHRVLAPGGIVGMSEPGKGHAETQASQHEVEQYGVLENELVIEDVAALARSCGFTAAHLLVSTGDAPWEIPAADLGAFIQGKGFTRYWEHQSDALTAGHYLVLYKGDPSATTRQPKAIGADIRPARGSASIETAAGQPARVTLHVRNPTETRWLSARGAGWTRLGGHLYRRGSTRQVVDFDWFRAELPRDVGQQERITMTVDLPPIPEPGDYEVVFDLVIEGVTWFADRGSRAASIAVAVRA